MNKYRYFIYLGRQEPEFKINKNEYEPVSFHIEYRYLLSHIYILANIKLKKNNESSDLEIKYETSVLLLSTTKDMKEEDYDVDGVMNNIKDKLLDRISELCLINDWTNKIITTWRTKDFLENDSTMKANNKLEIPQNTFFNTNSEIPATKEIQI